RYSLVLNPLAGVTLSSIRYPLLFENSTFLQSVPSFLQSSNTFLQSLPSASSFLQCNCKKV
ncbi:unnamed protein product, partial [Amoebophrya sp. A120]